LKHSCTEKLSGLYLFLKRKLKN